MDYNGFNVMYNKIKCEFFLYVTGSYQQVQFTKVYNPFY